MRGSALGAEGVVGVTSGVRGLVGGRLGSGRGLVSSDLSGAGGRVVSVLSSGRGLVGGVLSGGGSLVSSILGGGSGLVGEVVGGVLDVLLLDLSLGLVLGGVQVGRVGGISLTGTVLGLTDELGGAVGEVSGSALCDVGGVLGLLGSDGANLLGLLVDDGASILDLGVNDLAVVDVDEGDGVDQSGEEKSKTPGRHDLDEEVRDEGNEEGTDGDKDVLAEHDALELNDEEVDELLNIVQRGLEGLTGDGVVLARAHLRGEATVHDKLAHDFSGSSNWRVVSWRSHQNGLVELLTAEDDVERLEKVLEDGYVAGEEDEGED